MTHPTDPSRSTPPTMREIAELTARLRSLTGRGRDVDERERAAFLADKHALLARIAAQEPADSERRPNPWAATADPDAVAHTHAALRNHAELGAATDGARADEPWWAQAHSTDADTAPVTFDASGYYSTAEIAAIADARAAGDTERAQFLQDRPWHAQGVTVDTAHVRVDDDTAAQDDAARGLAGAPVVWPVMPEQMREQARRTEAQQAGTVTQARDDAAELAARVEALHQQITVDDPGPDSAWEGNRPTRPPCCHIVDDPDARREQLSRWHTDDTTTRADTDADVEVDPDGRVWGETDGSGMT